LSGEETLVAQAEAAFARGDYKTARALYSSLLDAAAAETRARADARSRALGPDWLAIACGVATVIVVTVAYGLALVVRP
jgi:hypothetical protein